MKADMFINAVKAAMAGNSRILQNVIRSAIDEEADRGGTRIRRELERYLTAQRAPKHPIEATGFGVRVETEATLQNVVLPVSALRTVNNFIKEQRLADALIDAGVPLRNKLLLHGPSGNGKTMLAHAIANEIGVPIFTVRFDRVIGSQLGQTSRNIGALMDAATPDCILFFDEFDSVSTARGSSNDVTEFVRVVNTVITRMDTIPQGCIMIAATNMPETIDHAIMRRFDISVRMPPPTIKTHGQLVDILCTKYNTTFPRSMLPTPAKSFAAIESFVVGVKRASIIGGV